MVNSEDFIKRLEFIIDYYSLSASSLADKIGVQRSSLSHLLSGRNKPSLDFILKILEVFPEVDLYWILNGKGSFPKNETQKISTAPTPITEIKFEENLFEETEKQETSNLIPPKRISNIQDTLTSLNTDKIEKIVIFYTNGKFVEYNP
ncbi:helix-turn-helix domain-containing protein [Flavobacterium luteum]|uniref:Helix-turn-helix transcriptional regulator n=1 Tax=Flavobacterium luteum TaxID=2026654 RepID=A0A7J5AKQ7_9FLAO|nr:helix-turn-helix transcriptional regulator [Flavobacterium luteum]KAB1158060.1 helix-turn-helix transcriptional regulator [Flavobacterium luteum]